MRHPHAACQHVPRITLGHARPRPARTTLTTVGQLHHAPLPRLRRHSRPVTLRRPPLLAAMLNTVVFALSASFRPLRALSSLSLFPPAAGMHLECLAHDPRSACLERGPVCTTNSCASAVSSWRAHAGADLGRNHCCPRLPTPHVYLQRCTLTSCAARGRRAVLPPARGHGTRKRVDFVRPCLSGATLA